jgi:DNA-binding MarR family transcriptional regulator
MRYVIVINQLAIIENEIDINLKEAILLDYLYWLCSSPSEEIEKRRIIKKGEKYTWFDYGSYLKETPILKTIRKSSVGEQIKKLEEEELIVSISERDNKKMIRKFIKLLPKADLLFRKTEKPITKVLQPYNEKRCSPITKNGVDNINNNHNNINNNPKGLEKPKASYGREDINEVINVFKQHLEGSPDGTIAENRRYARLLLDRLKKDYPDSDPVKLVEILMKIGMRDEFHGRNLTSPKYMYYHLQKIIHIVKNQKGRNSSNSKFINLD